MSKNNQNQQRGQQKRNPNGTPKKGGVPKMNFLNMIATVILVFILITGVYAEFSSKTNPGTAVPLSTLVLPYPE